MKENYRNTLIWVLIVGAIIGFFIRGRAGNDSGFNSDDDSHLLQSNSYQEENEIIDRYDAIYEHWDEIKDYVNGTETIEACSFDSGNCYDLDADISDGQVEEIYFPNGGYLYFSADIDESGNASDFDQNGNSWDFTIDMDSSMIDDAIYDWASDNDYMIE